MPVRQLWRDVAWTAATPIACDRPPAVKVSLTSGQIVRLFENAAGSILVAGFTGRRSLQAFIARLIRSIASLKALAPYAAIELLLPGGSLIALGLWFLKHRGHFDRHQNVR
jgi:hypothetical protein